MSDTKTTEPEIWPARDRKPTHHFVGKVLDGGETCVYVGKPKRGNGWVGENQHRTWYYIVRMGYRRSDGSAYSERYIQPIFDTFAVGGVKP
jgi:hypothetical protein